jgi:Zn finger protein HypA/HybF involved in hydrogenase expression
MHEFSIAMALMERVKAHLPKNTRLKSVTVRAGELRRIDPDALQAAWQALTPELQSPSAKLNLQETTGDELVLLSLDVDPIELGSV